MPLNRVNSLEPRRYYGKKEEVILVVNKKGNMISNRIKKTAPTG